MPKARIKTFTKEELETAVNKSHSMRELMRNLGYKSISGTSMSYVKRNLKLYGVPQPISTHLSPTPRTFENVFCKNCTADQKTVRAWYIKGNYSPYICSICGQKPEWNGQPLTLILDHISGEHSDSRLENLRWVCPNCNQQLETTGFKKIRVKK